MHVLFVAKFTKIRGLRSITVSYYKHKSSSEHHLRPLKIQVKCDQNILSYETTVGARAKCFICPPCKGTSYISYLSCYSTLFLKSVNHPPLTLRKVGHLKGLDRLKEFSSICYRRSLAKVQDSIG